MQTKPKTIEEVLAEFQASYERVYGDIFSPEVVKQGNAWFETFVKDAYSAGFAAGIEKCEEVLERVANKHYEHGYSVVRHIRDGIRAITPPEQKL